MTLFTPQFDQSSPGLITGYLRSEPMNGLTQQLTERGLPWAQVGDCLLINADALHVLPLLPEGSIDAVITDPPYSSGGQFRGDRMVSTRTKYQSTDVITEHPEFSGDNRDQRGWGYWCALWLGQCRRASKPGSMALMFCDWRQLPTATDAIQAGGFVWRGVIPWDKVVARPMPGRFRSQAEYVVWGTNGGRDFEITPDTEYLDGVFRVTTVPADERQHSTQKPEELIEQLTPVAPAGGTILDPFCGSFTTAVACIRKGRKFIGCEVEKTYFEIGLERCRKEVERLALFEPVPQVVQGGLFDG
jgi:site-specific DNA-methyltransferase (adenine-specific)